MATIIQRFSEGTYIVTKDGEEIPVYEGMEILPSDVVMGGTIATIETVDESPDDADISAIQQAILAGIDPTQVTDAAAAGGATQAGDITGDGGGNTFVALDNALSEVNPNAGYDTGGFTPIFQPIESGEGIISLFQYDDTPGVGNDDEKGKGHAGGTNIPDNRTESDTDSEDGRLRSDDDGPDADGGGLGTDDSDDNSRSNYTETAEDGRTSTPSGDDESGSEPGSSGENGKGDKQHGNNGFGNGDQDAPGNSLENNNAENAQDGESGYNTSDNDNTDNGSSSALRSSGTPHRENSQRSRDWGTASQESDKTETLVPSDLLDDGEETLEYILPKGKDKEDNSNKDKNNGWGNGDQDAPGNSLYNNNAENNLDGLLSPKEQYLEV